MSREAKTNVEIKGYKYAKTSITLGKNSEGKPIRKIFYGSTDGEAKAKKKQYIKDLENGLNPDLSNQSLEQAMNIWLWNIEINSGNKSSSFEKYEGVFRNYIKNSNLGMITISNIKKLAIQKYYNDLKKTNKSYSQINNLHKLLNKFFSYAEEEGYVVKNPCKGLKISKDDEEDLYDEDGEDEVVETFTKDEMIVIVKSLGHKKIRYLSMFAVLTRIREGELLALKKTDIKGDHVRINKTVHKVKVFTSENDYHYEIKVTKPKSKASNRTVPIPEILKPELEKLEKLVAEEKLKLGPAYIESPLLFPSLTGTYIDAKALYTSWKRVLAKTNVSYKKFHSLRHTYATRLFEEGSSILTVARLLGHSSTKTTEIYTHVLEDIKAKEVECLNDMFK